MTPARDLLATPRAERTWCSAKTDAPIKRGNVLALLAVHLGAVGALWSFPLEGMLCFVLMVTLTLNLGLIVCFHRLLSHRSFALPRWLELLFAFFGTCAAEAGPVTWVALHRKHHATADTHGDPHSPSTGWWWAYLGWTYHRFDVDLKQWARDVSADPAYSWLERWNAAIALSAAGWLYAAGYALGSHRVALSFLFWGFFLRIVCTWHVSFLVNSVAHGARPTQSPGPRDRSRNVWWLGVLAFGDGWHGTHHRGSTERTAWIPLVPDRSGMDDDQDTRASRSRDRCQAAEEAMTATLIDG